MAKAINVRTPVGQLNWVNITGEGKENMSGKLKYLADLVLPATSDACKALMAEIDAYWLANLPTGWNPKRAPKSRGYREETVAVKDDNGDDVYGEDGKKVKQPTGNMVFTFSTDTTYPSGDAKVISVYNAKGNKVALGDTRIGNGSTGQVGGAMGTYAIKGPKGDLTDAGVTLYLNSVRIIKLVEFSGEETWDDAGDDDGWTGEDNSWTGEPESGTPATPRL
ncbi:single stranded DNA binding protein [Edwardsiella phage ETP-1]|uniref:Single stranded DNA binding protein n=3 Tax=Kafunavirus KF1 TaxID=1982588 RepID=A0A6G5P4W1_9CAUD|nr:hypothetical protein D877_gp22 [Edwardsiella phage KF-1]QBP07020.1 single stranded DNA binding protein [Edwardsiella phage ETP-1]UIS54076.1 putative single stranded DNA binding protein [Edwardsiella phage vB_EpP_ZHX]BAM63070.1 hypothetical protein [Edwardsiella phage KF-1]BAM63119.1 hypothetical protein [Edwardsiella phage IW-1]